MKNKNQKMEFTCHACERKIEGAFYQHVNDEFSEALICVECIDDLIRNGEIDDDLENYKFHDGEID